VRPEVQSCSDLRMRLAWARADLCNKRFQSRLPLPVEGAHMRQGQAE